MKATNIFIIYFIIKAVALNVYNYSKTNFILKIIKLKLVILPINH
jgi:hypothetical protein